MGSDLSDKYLLYSTCKINKYISLVLLAFLNKYTIQDFCYLA